MTELNLIPIPKNSKACKIKGWQSLDYQAATHLTTLKNHRGNFGWVVPNNMMVLDIDTKAGKVGAQSLAELEAIHGNLPECPTQRTASGGFHKVFSLPEGVSVKNSAGKVGKDLDVRSDNSGYIVVEPSTIDKKPYLWIKHSPRETKKWNPPLAPEWLIKLAIGEGSGIKAHKIIDSKAIVKTENQDVARIRGVLSMMPSEVADSYDQWVKVGLALSNWSNGSELGLSMWDDWSKQSPSYAGGVCASKWAGFTPSQTNGVTVSSLFFMAKSLPLNDEGLVARLTSLFSEKMKYCPAIGWVRFKG
jgi:hypothetical protein